MTGAYASYGALSAKVKAMYGRRLRAGDFRRMAALPNVEAVLDELRRHGAWAQALAALETEERATRAALERALAPHGWAANTINTYLTRLADKGFLSARRLGRSNRYTPLVSREDYLSFDSRSVLSRLYGSSPRNFVAALARDGLAPGEVDELRALLDELERGAK